MLERQDVLVKRLIDGEVKRVPLSQSTASASKKTRVEQIDTRKKVQELAQRVGIWNNAGKLMPSYKK